MFTNIFVAIMSIGCIWFECLLFMMPSCQVCILTMSISRFYAINTIDQQVSSIYLEKFHTIPIRIHKLFQAVAMNFCYTLAVSAILNLIGLVLSLFLLSESFMIATTAIVVIVQVVYLSCN